MVTHLSTNRVRRRLTSLIEASVLTTTPDHHHHGYKVLTGLERYYIGIPVMQYEVLVWSVIDTDC